MNYKKIIKIGFLEIYIIFNLILWIFFYIRKFIYLINKNKLSFYC